MPRNYAKETEWQRGKYRQILFKVDIALADEFRAHLATYSIRPVDWFRHVVSLGIAPPDYVSAHADVVVSPDICSPDVAPGRRRRMVNVSNDLVARWAALYDNGMTFAQIAALSDGYEVSTIRKRVRLFQKQFI